MTGTRDLFTRMATNQTLDNSYQQFSQSQDLTSLNNSQSLEINSQPLYNTSTPIRGFPLTPINSGRRSYPIGNLPSVGRGTNDTINERDIRVGLYTILDILREVKPQLNQVSNTTETTIKSKCNANNEILSEVKIQVQKLIELIEKLPAIDDSIQRTICDLNDASEKSAKKTQKIQFIKIRNLIKKETKKLSVNFQHIDSVHQEIQKSFKEMIVNHSDIIIKNVSDVTDNISKKLFDEFSEIKKDIKRLDDKMSQTARSTFQTRCSPVATVRPQVNNYLLTPASSRQINEPMSNNSLIKRPALPKVRRTPVLWARPSVRSTMQYKIPKPTDKESLIQKMMVSNEDCAQLTSYSDSVSPDSKVESDVDITFDAVLFNETFKKRREKLSKKVFK